MTAVDTTTRLTAQTWTEPAGINPRGTLVLLTGRGEPPAVYTRFGRRLAADAYRVVAVDPADTDPAAEVRELVAHAGLAAPVVLVGSDTGAAAVLQLAADPTIRVDAVVLAGWTPGPGRADVVVEDDIEARTACPNHQQVLRRTVRPPVPAAVRLVTLGPPALPAGLPVLALHGSDDRISPLADALAGYAELGIDQVKIVAGGRHDVLNDVTHRSVAATLVLFLESLRLGPDLPAVVLDAPGLDPA